MVKIGIGDKPVPCDYYAVAGWNNTMQKIGVSFDVCFLGNSITCQSDFREFFPSKLICNLGYPGDDLHGMIKRIPAVKGVAPKQLFVMGGINGLKGQSLECFKEQYTTLVSSLCDSLPNTRIYLQSILPVNNSDFDMFRCDNTIIQSANEIIKEISLSFGCEYVDLHNVYLKNGQLPKELTKDGIHLKREAYILWAEVIKPIIENNDDKQIK